MEGELESAFRRTHYRVLASSSELLLRVDQHEPALATVLHANEAHCAALLTAFNPGGRRQAPFHNRRSQQRLQRELQCRGYTTIEGRNEDPRGRWPVEPSMLALGLPLVQARQLAVRYGQLAFLWMDESGTPRLIETAAHAG